MENNKQRRSDKKTVVGALGGEMDTVGRDSPNNQALFLQKIRESNEAVNNGDYHRAIQLYSEAIQLDSNNHILYTNRSAAFLKVNQYQRSLEDAQKARSLNSKWSKAYLREGVALKYLGQYGEALASFAAGLAQEPSNIVLLAELSQAAITCPLKDKLAPTFLQLEKLRLHRSPFVIISVIGQELLAAGNYESSLLMLESALHIGTCSLKLKGSVFSALSSAYWAMNNMDKAIYHMQQDLAVSKSLGDQDGECRAYGNLGSAYFSKGHYKEALSNHRYQLVIAMKLKDRDTAATSLSSLGHVYTAIGDYPNALNSHKQCVLLLKQSGDKLAEAREIGNVGAVYLAMNNFDSAVECHQEHLKMAKEMNSHVEEARAYSNLGSAYHYNRDFRKAILYHNSVLRIAEEHSDKALEARAFAGLGHAARCLGNTIQAKSFHEQQLDNALQTRDRVAESRACSNLGIIYHQLGEYEASLKLHNNNLRIAKALGDKAGQGRAYGNIGNAYSALCQHELAVKYHKLELTIASEVNDRHSEGSTNGNLAVAYQALGLYENALQHYLSHLNIARELKDSSSEARALSNLGNFHCARGDFRSAVSFYEQNLSLSQELHDMEGESKACFSLGYAHYSLCNYEEAVRYYEQDLSLAREMRNRLSLARAYCNLGLAHKSLKHFDDSLECQKKCLGLMDALRNSPGKFRALGNIGDLLLKTGDTEEAIKIYQQQLQLAKHCQDQDLLATAYGSLGVAHRMLGQYDKALAFHTQELNIRQENNNMKGECRAHGNMGNVHMSLGNYLSAFKCYEEQLERSRDLHDSELEGQACGNLGITKMNMGHFEESIGLFEQQLAMLEQLYGEIPMRDKGKAFGNLGDCYEALGDYEEAIKCHEQFLALAQQSCNLHEQDRAYRGLGNAHRAIGNLQQALVCFEKRLVVSHELNSLVAKASAYGELGCLHSLLGNFEQAISCLEHQLSISRDMGDEQCEGDAACGLGGVYQQMGEYEAALKYHQMDLQIAEAGNKTACQCRAYGNLGLSYESLGRYEEAVKHQEQHLSIAAQMNDRVAKTLAYSSLGRVHHALGHHTKAVQYLEQGLHIAEQLGRREDEAKIRHRLGLSLWGDGRLEECQVQLYKAADLFETIRRESQCSSDYKLSLFDLQSACYQTLQRVLVDLSRPEEALAVAERACTRAFIDLLLERQAGSAGLFNGTTMDLSPITIDQINTTVSKQHGVVLYFSIAAGFLYSWLLTPKNGLIKFEKVALSELEADMEPSAGDSQSVLSFTTASILENCVGQMREAIGVDSHIQPDSISIRGARHSIENQSGSESENDDVFQLQLEEIGDRLIAENDRTGFLRMVNRGHSFNTSTYSVNSILSLSSGAGGTVNTNFSSYRGNARHINGGHSPLSALYNFLLGPMEEALANLSQNFSDPIDLILVLQGDLYLIPFLMLRKEQAEDYLFERYNLIIVPSISALSNTQKLDRQGRPMIDSSGALVVGNPRLSSTISQHWHLHEIPGAEYESRIVGELLSCRPLIGVEATKGAILHQIEQVEVIHFATHISWKLSSIVLSPTELVSSGGRYPTIKSQENSGGEFDSLEGPPLSEYLLTAADILNLKLHAKLVVLNSGYTDDRAGRVNTDGVIGLTRALLSAGAQCVLFSLWPVPDQASKLLMRIFYTALEDNQRVTQALAKAVKTVQCTKQFSHPSNWGGWVLVGSDVCLSSKMALMGHAVCEILQSPTQCREAMRVLLHLIEKSIQRIMHGTKNSMYTTYQSIENKVGGVHGWKDLLQAVGFRFEPAGNGLPPAVFFPQSDTGDRLAQASANLQALLGLPPSSLTALSKFITNSQVGEALITVMRMILNKLVAKEAAIDVLVNVGLWRTAGCHEFLASFGLDLVDVGLDDVTLRLSKQAVRRHLQFALQALVAVFDAQEALTEYSLDTSSSLESLSSSPSGSSASVFSTPPLSPYGRRCSLFNPAEMEKMRSSKVPFVNQGDIDGKHQKQEIKSGLLDPSLQLSHQNRIRSMYPPHGHESGSLSSSPTLTDTGDSPALHPTSSSNVVVDLSMSSDTVSVMSESVVSSQCGTESTLLGNEQLAFKFTAGNLQDSCNNERLRQHSVSSNTSCSSSTSLSKSSLSKVNDTTVYNLQSSTSKKVMDPQEIAKRVMADMPIMREVIEKMQEISLVQSEMNSHKIRQVSSNIVSKQHTLSMVNEESTKEPCIHSPLLQHTKERVPNYVPFRVQSRSLHQKIGRQTNSSEVPHRSETVRSLVPSVIQVTSGQTGENSISSDNSEGADSNLQSSVSSGYHSEKNVTSDMTYHAKEDRNSYTKDFVNNGRSSYSSSSHALSSFRPYKPASPMVRTNAVQSRPDSTTSTSSQYSTSSSGLSAIYRPISEIVTTASSPNPSPSDFRKWKELSSTSLTHKKTIAHDSVTKPKMKVSFSESETDRSSNTSCKDMSAHNMPFNCDVNKTLSCPKEYDKFLECHSGGKFCNSDLPTLAREHEVLNSPQTHVSEGHGGTPVTDMASSSKSSAKVTYLDKDKCALLKRHMLQSSKC
ncbi:tetratricopeptide repeat protein 28-like [Haliotis cracherodii]|uniref:tetratricopeptide repeat protein 28-like n=1 Tax=Haliotis cracherodii TaxID=6455 RepID=UPI0039EA5417